MCSTAETYTNMPSLGLYKECISCFMLDAGIIYSISYASNCDVVNIIYPVITMKSITFYTFIAQNNHSVNTQCYTIHLKPVVY